MTEFKLINEIKNMNLDNSKSFLFFYYVSNYEEINLFVVEEFKKDFFEFIDLISKEGIHKRRSLFDITIPDHQKINEEPKFNYKKLYLGKDLSHFKENLNIKINKANGDFLVESNFADDNLNTEFNIILKSYKKQFDKHYNLYFVKSVNDSFLSKFKYYQSNFVIRNKIDNLNSHKNFVNNLFGTNEFQYKYGISQSTEIAYKIGEEYFHFKRGNFFKTNNKYKQKDTLELIKKYNLNFIEAMYLIGKLHCNQKNQISIIPSVETVSFDEKNAIELSLEFEDTLLDKYGKDKNITTIIFNNETIESKFNDFQAFHICKGLKNKQFLYELYMKGNYNLENRYQAHLLANKTLEKYGKSKIDFILSLPTLPFKADRFKVLFAKLDKMKGSINMPTLRFKIKNVENIEEDIEVEFFVQDGNAYKNQLRVKNMTTNQTMFDISRSGKVQLNDNLNGNHKNRNITPVIQLFYQISENEDKLNEAIILYGIESGKCSVCGRNLTDESSKLEGIGPFCKQYIS